MLTDDGLLQIKHENFIEAVGVCPKLAVGESAAGALTLLNRLERPVTVTAITTRANAPLTVNFEYVFDVEALGTATLPLRCRPFADGVNRQPVLIETTSGSVEGFVDIEGSAPVALVVTQLAAVEVPFVATKAYASIISLRILNVGSEPLAFTKAPVLPAGVELRFDWSTVLVKQHSAVQLELKVAPDAAGPQLYAVELFTNDPRRPALSVPVRVNAVERTDCSLSVTHETSGTWPAQVSTFQVRNTGAVGTGVCDLSGFRIEATDVPRSSTPQWLHLAPGQSARLEFAHQRLDGVLSFYGNSAELQPARIALSQTDPLRCLVVAPPDLDLGNVRRGCSATKTLTVYNACSEPGLLELLVRPAGQFSIDVALTNGVVLSPGAPLVGRVTFKPTALGAEQQALMWRFTRAGRTSTYTTTLTARGETSLLTEDVFQVPSRPSADLVFVVGAPELFSSDAGHMRDALVFNQPPAETDLRVLVMRAGDGGTLVLPRDGGADPMISGLREQVWAEVISRIETAAVGSQRSTMETVATALTTDPKLAPDGGFFRYGTANAILLNDGADSSPQSADAYRQQILGTWNSPKLNLFTVAPFANTSCTNGRQDDGRLAAFHPSGGTAEICAQWWWRPIGIAEPFSPTFHLNQRPFELAGLSVKRNGVPAPQLQSDGGVRWTYDPVSNAIEFAHSEIDYDDVIRVEYGVGCYP